MKYISNFNRREFIKRATLAALGIQFIPFTGLKAAPSDTLRVAHIGLGGMGLAHMNWFANLPDVEIVALCDVDRKRAEEALRRLMEVHPNTKAETYTDFRHVLDRSDVDAVTVATPDHWHAQIAILAFQSGKDVYGEKPLSYSAKEGQLMLKAQEDTGRIFQLGTQIHAGDTYHRAVELLQSGELGRIKKVRLWKTGEPPLIESLTYQTPPEHLDWDMWLGPAPFSQYAPEKCHFAYRYFMDYSGGIYQDFWSHIADVAFWALEPEGLKSVVARGEDSEGVGDTPKWLEVDYRFKRLDMHWSSTPPDVAGAAERGIGAYFEGTKGNLLCDYSSIEIHMNGQTLEDIPEVPKSLTRSPGHQQNFVDAVKARAQPESNLAYAVKMTQPMHLAMISYKLGRPLRWNARKSNFRNDAEADSLLWRPYREKWNLIGA